MASNDASSASMESTVGVLVSFFLATDETRGGGDSHMEQTGMLVGNFEFNP